LHVGGGGQKKGKGFFLGGFEQKSVVPYTYIFI
jgi:hypothetical protein